MALSQETFNAAYGPSPAWNAPAVGGMSFLKALQDAQAMKMARERQASEDAWRRSMQEENIDLRRAQMKQAGIDREQARTQAKRPGETTVRMLAEAQLMPEILGDVGGLIEKQPQLFGPVSGRAGAVNPYASEAQKANAQIEAAAQMVGKYMEGGVLRAEDVVKYKRMLPQLSDTPEVAASKMNQVQEMLAKKYNHDLEALTQGGYDVSRFQPLAFKRKVPAALPTATSKAKRYQIISAE